MKWQLHLWMKTKPDCTCLLSESRFPQALHSKLWNDISQIACCLGNAARHHRMGLEAWQPMEIQRAYAIKHEASFVTARSAGWMSFNITIKRLSQLARSFHNLGWHICSDIYKTSGWGMWSPYLHPAAQHTIYIRCQSKKKNKKKKAKQNIFYKTLTGCSAEKEANLLEALRNCFSEA